MKAFRNPPIFEAPSATNPTLLPNKNDPHTGFGPAAGQVIQIPRYELPYFDIPNDVFTLTKVIPDMIKTEVKHDAAMMADLLRVCTTEIFDKALQHKLRPVMEKYVAMEEAMIAMAQANQKLLDRVAQLEGIVDIVAPS